MQSLWMLFATFLFAAMGVCVKVASELYSTSEIVMYRGLIGMVFIYGIAVTRKGTIKTTVPWQHVRRSIVGVSSLWLWFYSISLLPLAMSMTLNYTAPIWMAVILFAIAWRSGKSRFEWGLAAAILASFIGIILLLRPTIQDNQWLGGLVALTSGMLSALAYLQVRRLGQLGEPEYRVVFYFSAGGAIVGMLGSLMTAVMPDIAGTDNQQILAVWHAHTAQGLALLLGIGISAALAQMAMTRAYSFGNTLVTANLQYTGIVFSSIWGIVIWGDMLNMLGWLGIIIIIASGIAATYYNMRISAQPKSAAPPDAIATEI